MRAAVICNPRAGKGNGGLDAALEVLGRAGWTLAVYNTEARDDATGIARNALQSGADAVLVAGGDGTLNEVVQALAGSGVPLGYLPYGTVNVWARELQLPLDSVAAAQALVDGRVEDVDLGRAGGRYFLLMAGIGFDGEVLRRARDLERYKSRFGVLPYVAAGLSTVPLYRGFDVELRYDGIIRRVQALLLVVSNTRLYGGRFQLTPNAVANDGWLDVCIVKGRGPLAMVRQSLPILVMGSVTYSDVEMLRVKHLVVHTDRPVAFQLDGELSGATPVELSVAPRALKAIVPRTLTSSLIA